MQKERVPITKITTGTLFLQANGLYKNLDRRRWIWIY